MASIGPNGLSAMPLFIFKAARFTVKKKNIRIARFAFQIVKTFIIITQVTPFTALNSLIKFRYFSLLRAVGNADMGFDK